MPGPLDMIEALARQEVVVTPTYRHLEVFTMRGLLTILWHGAPDAEAAVVLGGGAMGGLLGPADGFYHWLGEELADPVGGIGVLRVGWRRPNDIDLCTLDLLAAADLAARAGAERFVTGGHSFGGAIAVRAGMAMGDWTRGVVTFATQSAGCEEAAGLAAPLRAPTTATATRSFPPRPVRSWASWSAGRPRSSSVRGRVTCCRRRGAVARRGRTVDPGAARYGLT